MFESVVSHAATVGEDAPGGVEPSGAGAGPVCVETPGGVGSGGFRVPDDPWSSLRFADIDAARAELVRLEKVIGAARGRQVEIVSFLDAALVARVERARSTEEWVAAAVDVSPSTARDVVAAARAGSDTSGLLRGLEAGRASFDRVVATVGLVAAGATDDQVAASWGRDVAAVRRLTAEMVRVTRVGEREVMRRRHLEVHPTMANQAWRITGIAPGCDGDVISRALERRADRFPTIPGEPGEGRRQRMLDALTSLCHDYLGTAGAPDRLPARHTRRAEGDAAHHGEAGRDSHPDPAGHDVRRDCAVRGDRGGCGGDGLVGYGPLTAGDLTSSDHGDERADPLDDGIVSVGGGATVTVFIDAQAAAATSGELGGSIAAGPRIGPDTIERILCGGSVRIVGLDDKSHPVTITTRSRHIPPAIRDLVLRRDGGCVIDGCRSRYRLQPHHIRPRSRGGTNHPDNLATLCWYHHHVVIHGLGYRLDPHTPPQRRRFLRPAHPDPP